MVTKKPQKLLLQVLNSENQKKKWKKLTFTSYNHCPTLESIIFGDIAVYKKKSYKLKSSTSTSMVNDDANIGVLESKAGITCLGAMTEKCKRTCSKILED